MATQVSSRLLASFKNISQTAGISGIVLGCLVLIGWQFDIPSFKSVLPGPLGRKGFWLNRLFDPFH